MRNLILVLVFVSSCGPLKLDKASAAPWLSGPTKTWLSTPEVREHHEVLGILQTMHEDMASCDDMADFLRDTALDHNVESFSGCDF